MQLLLDTSQLIKREEQIFLSYLDTVSRLERRELENAYYRHGQELKTNEWVFLSLLSDLVTILGTLDIILYLVK